MHENIPPTTNTTPIAINIIKYHSNKIGGIMMPLL
jgi:hypothetical protein